MPKPTQIEHKDILNADTYKNMHSIIGSIRETVKANRYGNISVTTLNEYFDIYEKYCDQLSKGNPKMQAYEFVSIDACISAEVVRRAVSKIDNLICKPLEQIKDVLSETDQQSISMNRLTIFWEVFNKFRFWYEVYGLNKMDAYKETALNLNLSVKHVRHIVSVISKIIANL